MLYNVNYNCIFFTLKAKQNLTVFLELSIVVRIVTINNTNIRLLFQVYMLCPILYVRKLYVSLFYGSMIYVLLFYVLS